MITTLLSKNDVYYYREKDQNRFEQKYILSRSFVTLKFDSFSTF